MQLPAPRVWCFDLCRRLLPVPFQSCPRRHRVPRTNFSGFSPACRKILSTVVHLTELLPLGFLVLTHRSREGVFSSYFIAFCDFLSDPGGDLASQGETRIVAVIPL